MKPSRRLAVNALYRLQSQAKFNPMLKEYALRLMEAHRWPSIWSEAARDPDMTLAVLGSLSREGRLVLMGSMTVPLLIPYTEVMRNSWENH
jgi:hypothetical protein